MRVFLAVVLLIAATILAIPGVLFLVGNLSGFPRDRIAINDHPVNSWVAIAVSLIPAIALGLIGILLLSMGGRRVGRDDR